MSNLGKIAVKALRAARTNLGPDGAADTLSIDSGDNWDCTRAEERTNRDYEEGGQQVEIEQTVVGETAEFEAIYSGTEQSYLGKSASLSGTTYRVGFISKGEAFTEVGLRGAEESP